MVVIKAKTNDVKWKLVPGMDCCFACNDGVKVHFHRTFMFTKSKLVADLMQPPVSEMPTCVKFDYPSVTVQKCIDALYGEDVDFEADMYTIFKLLEVGDEYLDIKLYMKPVTKEDCCSRMCSLLNSAYHPDLTSALEQEFTRVVYLNQSWWNEFSNVDMKMWLKVGTSVQISGLLARCYYTLQYKLLEIVKAECGATKIDPHHIYRLSNEDLCDRFGIIFPGNHPASLILKLVLETGACVYGVQFFEVDEDDDYEDPSPYFTIFNQPEGGHYHLTQEEMSQLKQIGITFK